MASHLGRYAFVIFPGLANLLPCVFYNSFFDVVLLLLIGQTDVALLVDCIQVNIEDDKSVSWVRQLEEFFRDQLFVDRLLDLEDECS